MRTFKFLIVLLLSTIWLTGCGKQTVTPEEVTQTIPVEYPFAISENADIIQCTSCNMFALNSVIFDTNENQSKLVCGFDKNTDREDAKQFLLDVENHTELYACYLYGWDTEGDCIQFYETDDCFYISISYQPSKRCYGLFVGSDSVSYWIENQDGYVYLKAARLAEDVDGEEGCCKSIQSMELPHTSWTAVSTEFQAGLGPIIADRWNAWDAANLDGMEVVIGDWWSNPNAEPTNEYEEYTAEYIEWIEDYYNCKITRKTFSSKEEISKDFAEYVASGGDVNNYLWLLPGDETAVQALRDKYMYDLTSLEDSIDFEEYNYRKNRYFDSFTYKNYKYAMSDGFCNTGIGVIYNKKTLQEYGIDYKEIFQSQESGDWTWVNFVELLERIRFDENRPQEMYGLAANKEALKWAGVLSNGGSFYERNGEEYISKLGEPAAVEALQWIDSLYASYISPDTLEESEIYREKFLDGEAVFLIDYVDSTITGNWLYEALADEDAEIGVFTFPRGPQSDPEVYRTYSENPLVVIPACYDKAKAWKLAYVWSLISKGTPGYEGNCSDYTALYHRSILPREDLHSYVHSAPDIRNEANYSLLMPEQ